MRTEENIRGILDYFQASAEKSLDFDEASIFSDYQKNNHNQSLSVKILTVFGGVLACLSFLGFILLAGLYNSGNGLLTFGMICIAGSIWINKQYDKIIMDTVSVSFFLIGFILLGFGFSQLKMDENVISIIFIVISCCSLLIVQDYMLSFISVLVINGSILMLIISNKGHDLIHVYVSALALAITYLFLNEARIIAAGKAISRLYNPVRIGLIFSFLTGLVFLSTKGIVSVSPGIIWISSIVIIAAIIYLESNLFDLFDIARNQHKALVYVLTILLLLPTVFCPGIPGAILIMLLSFTVNNKTGLVLGMMSFTYFVSQYYYDLDFTLLTKSIFMISSGILLTAIYLFTHKKLTINEKV